MEAIDIYCTTGEGVRHKIPKSMIGVRGKGWWEVAIFESFADIINE